MMRRLHNLVTALLIAAAVATTAPPVSALQQTDVAAAERQYELLSGERTRLLEQLGQLEDRYRGLVSRIERLKSDGAMGTLGGRIELQNLLTQSKAVADELDALQAKIRVVDNRMAGQRSVVVGGLDERVAGLERALASASPASRRAIVAELNALRRQRASYTTPLPEAPQAGDLHSAIRLAEEASHPEELLAAADELQDTEDQLRRRLAAIEAKLDDLRDAQALARRARSFSREEKFFEETDRDRVIARYDKVTVTSTPKTSSPDETGGNNSAGAADPPTDDQANYDANNAFEPVASPSAEGDFASGRGEPTVSDAPGEAPVAAPTAGGDDVFETSRETIVIDGGTDPARATGAFNGAATDLDSQIRRLEAEQKELSRQANGLRKRAKELRKRAEKL